MTTVVHVCSTVPHHFRMQHQLDLPLDLPNLKRTPRHTNAGGNLGYSGTFCNTNISHLIHLGPWREDFYKVVTNPNKEDGELDLFPVLCTGYVYQFLYCWKSLLNLMYQHVSSNIACRSFNIMEGNWKILSPHWCDSKVNEYQNLWVFCGMLARVLSLGPFVIWITELHELRKTWQGTTVESDCHSHTWSHHTCGQRWMQNSKTFQWRTHYCNLKVYTPEVGDVRSL